MPARGARDMGMPNTAPSQPPSEAQSRGIYGSCGSPTSNVTHLGRYELKRSPNEEAGDRGVKRRRDAEEWEEVEDEEEEEEEEEDDDDDDEPIAPSDNVKMRRGFMSFSRAGMVTLKKIVIPSRGGSEHRQTSQPRMSASNGGEAAIESTTDPYLQQFLHPPIPDPNTTHPPRTPSQAQDQPSHAPTHDKDFVPTSAPTEPSSSSSADDSLVDTIEARMRAFEDEERTKQHQHEEHLARRRLQQKMELERELEEKIERKRHEADVARRAAVQKQEEEHERMMGLLRRR